MVWLIALAILVGWIAVSGGCGYLLARWEWPGA